MLASVKSIEMDGLLWGAHKLIHLDALDRSKHLVVVRLVIPWLDIKEDGCLSDDPRLLRFLLMIGLQPLLSDPLLLLTLLLVRASKEVDIIVLLLSRCLCSRFASLKLTNASLQREDKRLQVVSDFLQLLVLHLQGIELLHKSHVFAAARS